MSRTVSLSAVTVFCATLAVHAPALGQSPTDSAGDESTASDKAYLGLQLSPVPELLSMHLPEVLPPDSGLLIVGVAPDSPAARDGLESNDILVRFDGKEVSDYEKLIEYMDQSRPDQTVELTVVRRGKLLGVEVTFGRRPTNLAMDKPPRQWPAVPGFPAMPDLDTLDDAGAPAEMQEYFERMNKIREEMNERFRKGFGGKFPKTPPMPKIDADAFSSSSQSSSSSNFSSINVNKIGDDRYSAQVKYKAADGEIRELIVEGTTDEIREAAEQDDKMPAKVRKQLLRVVGGEN